MTLKKINQKIDDILHKDYHPVRMAIVVIVIVVAVFMEKKFSGLAEVNDDMLYFLLGSFSLGLLSTTALKSKYLVTTFVSKLKHLPKLNDKAIEKYIQNLSQVNNHLSSINENIKKTEVLRGNTNNTEIVAWNLESNSETARIELNADTVWIMSNNLELDTTDEYIKSNVVKNLKGDYLEEKGSEKTKARYCYIVPKTEDIRTNIYSMKRFWGEKNIPKLDICNVIFILVDPKEWLQAHDVSVYNGMNNDNSSAKYKKIKIMEYIKLRSNIESKSTNSTIANEFVSINRVLEKNNDFVNRIKGLIMREYDLYSNNLGLGCWNLSDRGYLEESIKEAQDNNEETIYDLNNDEFEAKKFDEILNNLDKMEKMYKDEKSKVEGEGSKITIVNSKDLNIKLDDILNTVNSLKEDRDKG